MSRRRRVFICLCGLFIVAVAAFASTLVAPRKANVMISFIGYTNAGQERLASFSVTNAGAVSVSVHYVIYLQPGHTDPVRIQGGPGLRVRPKQHGVFSVAAPQSSRRWQLAVGFVQESQLLIWSRWCHYKLGSTWLDRLVPRLKEGPLHEVLTEWIEY
jgi:hypothetical protein